MKDQKKQIAKLARQTNLYYDEYVAAKERTLKTASKMAANKKLYLDGYRKGLMNIPLDSFTDLIEENGKMVQRKDHRSFKAGYNHGIEELNSQEYVNNNKSR